MIKGSEHVGELQLHLQTIIDIKEAAHRTYALMRSVGWQVVKLHETRPNSFLSPSSDLSSSINPQHSDINPQPANPQPPP